MPLVLAAVLVVVAVMMLFWLTFNIIPFLMMLFIAGVVGWLADLIVPGQLPYGWLGAILAGLVGSWLGTLVLGHLGPTIFGISVLPALLGAIVLAFVAQFASKALASPRRI
jgi:uncharacterized membrane protein YeaQ/YmgE (transglycosylase-associated protein family)